MLSFLRGTILAKTEDYLIVDVHDIGYQVFVTSAQRLEAVTSQPIEVYLYQVVREDASDLYGFKKLEELQLFEKLLSVSGVGPKSALAIIGLAPADAIRQAIERGEVDVLTKVSGIGRKTAERIVLELRGKLPEDLGAADSGLAAEIEALVSLGYSATQARDALRSVDPSITDSGERIKAALKHI